MTDGPNSAGTASARMHREGYAAVADAKRIRVISRFAVCAGLLVALVAGPAMAWADEPLRLVTGTGYPPFSDETLPEGGLATAIVKAAFDAAGLGYTIDIIPWKRGYAQTVDTAPDATFPYTPTEARHEAVLYSDPLFELPVQIFSAASAPIIFHGPPDVLGKTICEPIGFVEYWPFADMIRADRLTLLETHSLASCARNIVDGRAQFIVATPLVANYAAKAAGVEGRLVALGDVLTTDTLHLVVGKANKRATEILDAFNDGLRKIRENGRFDAIVKPTE